ncbi:MAG: 1,4-dihydroxy-2-naphthoate polyprenyltransferase [Acidimicrobiales bacterium]
MSEEAPVIEEAVASEETPIVRGVRRWVLGARPRTLPAAVVPVVVGTAVGWYYATVASRSPAVYGPIGISWTQPLTDLSALSWWRFALALIVSLAIEIGTNYANDYSDGVRGTDEARAGPLRLVASKSATPRAVKTAAIISFGLAGVAGIGLSAVTTWWLIPVGLLCVAAGWLYTGGPKPYGYAGLGELFVFVFFGLVATGGSAYVQSPRAFAFGIATGREFVPGYFAALVVVWASIAVGMLATSLLQANNLRDVSTDAIHEKKTLAVRVGRKAAGRIYVGSLLVTAVAVLLVAFVRPWALLAFVAAPLAIKPSKLALSDAGGRDLLPLLAATGRLQLLAGMLLAVGVIL